MAALHSLSNLSSLNKDRAQTLHWLVIVVLLLICSTLSVLCVFLVFFSSPPQRPVTSEFEGFQSQILSITFFPISILEKEPVFACACCELVGLLVFLLHQYTWWFPCFPLASVHLVVSLFSSCISTLGGATFHFLFLLLFLSRNYLSLSESLVTVLWIVY